jgi:hypothetical protein
MPASAVRFALPIALLLLVQGAARAAPLQWEGTFSFEFLTGLPSFRDEGGGGVASVNASSGGLPAHLETLHLAANRQKCLATVETGLLTQGPPLTLTASLDTGTFSTWTFGFGHFPTSTTVPTKHLTPLHQIHRLSIQAAPWTIRTATGHGFYPPFFDGNDMTTPVSAARRGFAHAPASTTTSTARIGGILQMVTPRQVRRDTWYERPVGYWSHLRWVYGGFAVLTVRFIPEPGVGLLLATGIAGLVAIGRRRMRE